MVDKKEEDKNIIFSYTRKQAIDDGVLIDVTEMAKEAGIKYPVAVTAELYDSYITPTDEDKGNGQSIEGRLWDTLWMFRCAAKGIQGNRVDFEVFYTLRGKQELTDLYALCTGEGENGEPVITIMLPWED